MAQETEMRVLLWRAGRSLRGWSGYGGGQSPLAAGGVVMDGSLRGNMKTRLSRAGAPLPHAFAYCSHAAVSDETACHIAAQSPSDNNRVNSSPAPSISVVAAAVGSD